MSHPDDAGPAPVHVAPPVVAARPTVRSVPVTPGAHAVPGGPHARYAALRAERARVARWRRLVRARMDLAAAALALPEALGEGVAPHLPAGVVDDLPPHVGLLTAVSTGGPEGEIDRLEALRDLDDRLARYELTVTRAMHAAVAAGMPPALGSMPG